VLEGRRIYFVGIGGAGLSSYAYLARAWGAEVAGWDRRETPYLRTLDGVAVDLGGEPRPPEGWEVVVSSAHRDRAGGRTRAEFLAELVSLRDAIVVAGAHGTTTTTAMIAFVLRELGRDPAWLIGGEVPQLGGNAGAGAGWLVVEGDESDRTVERLRPRVAVVTIVELDHHTEYASEAEVAALLEAWLDAAPAAVRGWRLEAYDAKLAVPGEHNRQNAATPLAAHEHAGVTPAEAAPLLEGFVGVGRRFQTVA
jgi:UDP-N-acetylmuramate--alanine ligase